MGPSLARIMEQRHIGQPVPIIHMAASTQNLGGPGVQGKLPKRGRDPRLSLPGFRCSHLIADDIDLVLDLGHPLAHNGEQLRDGGLRVKQNLLAGRVIGVEEGEGWGGERSKVTQGKLDPPSILRQGGSRSLPLRPSNAGSQTGGTWATGNFCVLYMRFQNQEVSHKNLDAQCVMKDWKIRQFP